MKKKNRFNLFACFCLVSFCAFFSEGKAETVGITKWLNPDAWRGGQIKQASLNGQFGKKKSAEKQSSNVSDENLALENKKTVEKTEPVVVSSLKEEKKNSDSVTEDTLKTAAVETSSTPEKKTAPAVSSQNVAASEPDNPDNKEMLTITSEGGFLLPTYVLPEVREDILSVKSGLLQQDSPFRTPAAAEETKNAAASSEVSKTQENQTVMSWTEKDSSFVPLKEDVQEKIAVKAPVLLEKPVETAATETVVAEKAVNVPAEEKTSKVVVENATEEEKAEGKTNEDLMVQRLEKEYEEASDVLSETDLSLIRYASAIAETAREIEKLEARAANIVDLDNPEEVEGIALASASGLQETLPDQTETPVFDKPLLLPLAARAEKVTSEDVEILEEEPEKKTVSAVEKILQKGKDAYKLLPNEIKISFRPDNADISGQTLKWIRAFASQIVQDPTKYVEMRVSAYGLAGIQSRRVLLLKGTLLGSGLNPSQIRIVSTPRDSDSIVLRIMEKEDDMIEITEYAGAGRTKQKKIKSW
jgi:hypothetical protein